MERPAGYRPSRLRAVVAGPGAGTAARAYREIFGAAPGLEIGTHRATLALDPTHLTEVDWDAGGRTLVAVHGDVVRPGSGRAAEIARTFRDQQDAAARALDGAFALLVVDRAADRILLVTDRLAARRVFLSRGGGNTILTSRLEDQPHRRHDLDPTGVAWYLCSGCCRLGRTPYEGIRVAQRASILELTPAPSAPRPYWSHGYRRSAAGDGDGPVEPRGLARALADRMVDAVARRVEGADRVFLSLSGGHDSTALAIVLHRLQVPGVLTFSYVHGSHRGKDVEVAAATARRLGFDHTVVESYDGDLLGWYRAAARASEGVALAASELHGWQSMERRFEEVARPVVLVGDEYMGHHRYEPPDLHALWFELRYRGFRFPLGMEDLLPRSLARRMRQGLDEDRRAILARQPPAENLWELRELLRLDYRLVHLLLPWRECYVTPRARAAFPLLDREVLDLMLSVPRDLRRDKRLFLQAVEHLDPAFSSFRRCDTEGYRPDWSVLIAREENALRSWIRESTSRLDALVPTSYGARLLEEVVRPRRRAVRRAVWAMKNTLAATLPGCPPLWAPRSAESLFRSWALLRMALAEGDTYPSAADRASSASAAM